MKRVAFATCRAFPKLADDDRLLIEPCRQRGMDVAAGLWEDEKFPWASYDAVVIRSPWNYYLRYQKFLEWIGRLKAAGVNLWNPAELVVWNSHKKYLRDLENAGINVIPTEWTVYENPEALANSASRIGGEAVVVKPAVSAGAHETFVLNRGDLTEKDALEAAARRWKYKAGEELMIQPLIRDVFEHGELSLLFFGGRFSHAVRKRPPAGDFRTQEKLGGTIDPHVATERERQEAAAILKKAEPFMGQAGKGHLYARVDLIPTSRKLLLGELEMTEPSLFFKYDETAPARFADELLKRLK